jgi:hypothetical protein
METNYERAFVMDVSLAAALRCFFAKTLDAMGMLPDAHFMELELGCARCSLSAGLSPMNRPLLLLSRGA